MRITAAPSVAPTFARPSYDIDAVPVDQVRVDLLLLRVVGVLAERDQRVLRGDLRRARQRVLALDAREVPQPRRELADDLRRGAAATSARAPRAPSGSLPIRIMFAPACADRSGSRPSSLSAFLSFPGPFAVRVHLSMFSWFVFSQPRAEASATRAISNTRVNMARAYRGDTFGAMAVTAHPHAPRLRRDRTGARVAAQ